MSKSETKRAVAYLRVSNLSQVDGHSLDAQDRLFHQLCDNRDWEAAPRLPRGRRIGPFGVDQEEAGVPTAHGGREEG